jgi:flagellar secretion chaperone FliS
VATPGKNPYKSYIETQIETASPEKLLIMLYNGALQKCREARSAIDQEDRETTHLQLIRVQEIMVELMVALDWDKGGDIAKGLYSVYDYIYRRLVEANIQCDVGIVEEVEKLLEMLLEGWQKALENISDSQPRAAAGNDTPPPQSGSLNIQG